MSEAAPYCTQIAGVKKGCSSRDRTSEVKECSSRDRASEVKECSSRDRTTGVKKEYSESGQAGYSDCHIICSFQIMWRLLLLSLCLGFRSCGFWLLLSRCCGFQVMWRLVINVTVLWLSDHVASGCHAHSPGLLPGRQGTVQLLQVAVRQVLLRRRK